MNTDIIEFTELSKTVKTNILKEHKTNLLKKQEEINDLQSLINKHISIIDSKLTALTSIK